MQLTVYPDLANLEIPMDVWTRPFWLATQDRTLLLPRCGECGWFRWPPGPFCRTCRSQVVAWVAPGRAEVYSFTLLPAGADGLSVIAPALLAFPDAGGIRLPAAIVDTPLDLIRIGAPATPAFAPAHNEWVPVFVIHPEPP